MAKCRKHFASASRTLKYATLFMLIVLILHIIAFSTPNWATVRLSVNENSSGLWLAGSDHSGLWQICSCISAFGDGFCSCFGRHGDPVWFKMTQAMETLALIGYVITGIISFVQLFSEQDRKVKRINVFVTISSGVLGCLGVIVFGVRSPQEYKDTAEFFDQIGMELHGHLDFSFYLSCVAVVIVLLVCTPLYMKDEKMPLPVLTQDIPVVYNNQSLVISPDMLQGGVFVTDIGRQAVGNLAANDAPPAYTISDQQSVHTLNQPPFDGEIPFKE